MGVPQPANLLYQDFIESGYRIFGLNGADRKGNCACGNPDCKAAYKHPVASNWQHTPDWSDEQIEVMEMTGQLRTGYGVLVRGLLVIDIDARNGGVDSYSDLLEDVPSVAAAGLIVNTGSGGGSKHLYFSIPADLSLVQHLDAYKGIDFKSSGFVVGPGSLHASGNTYEVGIGSPADIEPAPQELLDLLARHEFHRTDFDGHSVDISHADVADMLSHIDPDSDHEVWVRAGMAAHHATGGTGFDVWDAWSSKGAKYPGTQALEKRWWSFGKSANPVTLGTLAHYAQENGWEAPVSFQSDIVFDEPAPHGLPFDISGIDLKQPPGFVGTVANWIEDQSRRPRETLAVAGALVAIGNIAGLRYMDERDNVTTNLFAFGIAGSRTGKEAIMQAVNKIHRVAGMAPAAHGAIKSEQEITRNLTRHQAAVYVIDEIGIFLGKIKNAQKSGGAAYLDGVIGALMSAYSKANSTMLLTGDAKEDVRAGLAREIIQLQKKIENNEALAGAERAIEALTKTLNGIDGGLDRPFLSLMGFTTPVTFDELVDYQSATNGFIGRSLLFNERDTAPRSKRRFKARKMPPEMELSLISIYQGGEYDQSPYARVENYAPRVELPTSDNASDMLDDALDWFEDQAIEHKSITGLESLWLGAYEIVSKVSTILAVAEGVRSSEHVRWAFALVRRDVEEKMRLVTANDRVKDAPKLALMARIANYIADDWVPQGEVRNRCRGVKNADVDAALVEMVQKGTAEVETGENKFNKKKWSKYRLKS